MNIENSIAIIALKHQIESLKIANLNMEKYWGQCTNEVGFKFCKQDFVKNLANSDYVCPFSSPVNGHVKPWLRDSYIDMNNSMIEIFEREIARLQQGNEYE